MEESTCPIVSPQWLEEHLGDPRVRVVQSDMSPDDYREGHIPGAVFWHSLADFLLPDLALNLDRAHLEALLSRSGITRDTILVFSSCWVPTMPLLKWIVGLVGHPDSRVLDGGSPRWKREGRPLEVRKREFVPTTYRAGALDNSTRAFLPDVRDASGNSDSLILDVRSPQEFGGEWFMMEPPTETQRAGHIAGALHLPYEMALRPNETFKSPDELCAVYAAHGVTPERDIITYCAVGARSALTWFVLSEVLGFPHVRNYDGAWNEWSQKEEVCRSIV